MAHFEEKPTTENVDRRLSIGTDVEKSSSAGYANSTTGNALVEVNAQARRKVLLKLDVLIMPLVVLLYLSAYLDRGNLANARLQGMQAQALDGSDEKYSLALASFFITYIVLSTPGTLAARLFNPSRTIAIGALIWSIAASCQAAVQNPAGVYVCRLFVGVGESMFGQATIFYLSLFYPKRSLAKRVAFFIGAGALAGAFGGLIAYGVAQITNPAIAQWRILFLIEGIPSVVLAVVVFLFLPSRPEYTRYLTEDQRTTLITLLNEDNANESGYGLDWKAIKRAALNPLTYIFGLMYSCMNLDLGSVGGFLPTIVKNLGYSNADAQLYTVPPYACAFFAMLLFSAVSDHLKLRGPFVMIVFAFDLIGWGLLLGVPTNGNQHARYAGTFFITMGGYIAIPLITSWVANNTPNHSQRAFSLGVLNTIGQCLAVLAAYSFPSSEGPRYTRGAYTNVGFQVFGLLIAFALSIWFWSVNRKRDVKEGGRPARPTGDVETEYDLAEGFRYTL